MKVMKLRTSSRVKTIVLSAAALAAAGIVVVGLSNVASPSAPASAESTSTEVPSDSEGNSFPTNASGETYGSLLDATNDDDAPDLILVELPDGSEGYVRADDFFEAENAEPASPEEAIAEQEDAQRETRSAKSAPESLPVFESDGETRIGTWDGIEPAEELPTEE